MQYFNLFPGLTLGDLGRLRNIKTGKTGTVGPAKQ